MYCTCGQCLIDSESRRKPNKLRLDALSIPNYLIKKGLTHGTRHVKTGIQRESTTSLGIRGRDAVRKSTLKVNISQVFTIDFSEIQFIVNHISELDGQNKSAKSGMNLHNKTIHIKLTPEEKRRYKGQRSLTLNKAGKNRPLKLRSEFRAAVSMKNRLHHESGEQVGDRLHPNQQRRWHSSSSVSWWEKSGWNWK